LFHTKLASGFVDPRQRRHRRRKTNGHSQRSIFCVPPSIRHQSVIRGQRRQQHGRETAGDLHGAILLGERDQMRQRQTLAARRVSIDGAIARGCLKKGKQLDSFFLLAAKVALETEDRPDFLPVQQDWRPAISLLNQFFLDVLPALAGAGSG